MIDTSGQDSWEGLAQESWKQQAYAAMQNSQLGASLGAAQGMDPNPRPNPNEVPAYSMKLRDLVTLWEAKFGESWVDVKELREDAFWIKAIDRMGAAGLFEVTGGYYRLKVL